MEQQSKQKEEVKSIDELRSAWNAFAPVFAEYWSFNTSVPAYALAVQLQLGSAKRVLEIGCGAGVGTDVALVLTGKDTVYVATDLAPDFLEFAKKRLAGRPNLEFGLANAEELPYPNASFDRYIANFVLHLTPSPAQMLKEARRVLDVGGMAGFSVWGEPAHSAKYTVAHDAAVAVGLTPAGAGKRNAFHLKDKAALKQMALDAGFSRAIVWNSVNALPMHSAEALVDREFEGPGLKSMLSTLSPEQLQQYRSAAIQIAQAKIDKDGIIDYDTVYLLVWV
eukprot:TRINITY_DN5551_c0_g1_i1.p1 TRINITY_DN5551_c0_g1~~TRINITY_DN5551_c0_g1_i1.p1  ORF type:complete len:280 (-),score=57.95 TRINITY_DN5551_c0_g1_i1:73-912(-)